MNIFGDFYEGLTNGRQRYLGEKHKAVVEYCLPFPAEGEIKEEGKRFPLPFLYFLLAVVFLRLIIGLTTIQIFYSSDLQRKAEQTRVQTVTISSVRGIILDSKGTPLVKNVPTFNVGLIPTELPMEKLEKERVLKKVAEALSLDLEEIKKNLLEHENKLEPLILKENLNREEALVLESKFFGEKGVSIFIAIKREYDKTQGLSHILGYIGRMSEEDIKSHPDYLPTESIGRAGIEAVYDNYLRGEPGYEKLEVTSEGIAKRILGKKEPTAGASIELYLDKELQVKVGEALKRSIEKSQASSGAVIIMDVNSGGILASVSLPDFDNNLFSSGIKKADFEKLTSDKNAPLLNRAIAGQYPSGSTIKPFIAVAALNEKVVSEKLRVQTPPYIEIGKWKFLDWKPHGSADIRQAIAESNNIFFYAIGGGYQQISGLGIGRITDYLNRFGFGNLTKVDLTGEARGLVPSPEWKKKAKNESWYIGDTYNLSIGQGDLLITPLQLVRGIAAIANGGKLLTPFYVHKIKSVDGRVIKEFMSEVVSENFVSEESLRIVREGMRQAVESGTARPLQSVAVAVAAKTGTAQFSNIDKEKTHAWTVAFAPYEKPEIAIAVVVEGGGESFEIALPAVQEILEFRYGKRE